MAIVLVVAGMYPMTRSLRVPACRPLMQACRQQIGQHEGPLAVKSCMRRLLENGVVGDTSFESVLLGACRRQIEEHHWAR